MPNRLPQPLTPACHKLSLSTGAGLDVGPIFWTIIMTVETDEDRAGYFDPVNGFAILARYQIKSSDIAPFTVPVLQESEPSDFSIGGQPFRGEVVRFLVRASDVAQPADGDTITITGDAARDGQSEVFKVSGPPEYDRSLQAWRLSCSS